MSLCRTCGKEFEQSGKGRPRLDCLTCRPAGSNPSSKAAQKSVARAERNAVGAGAPPAPTAPTRDALHKFNASHLNPNWCADCRQWIWDH